MTVTVTQYCPMTGTPAEALWREGEASYVSTGRAARANVTYPHPDNIGWVGFVGGQPAGIQVCRIPPGASYAFGLLSWVRPEFRRHGVFRAVQTAVDTALLAMGINAIHSSVVDGPDAEAMAAAIVARGGNEVGRRVVNAMSGPVTYIDFIRPVFLRLV